MLAGGFLDEVRALRARGDLHLDLPAMRCVGYRQAWEALDGAYPMAELRDRGIQDTLLIRRGQMKNSISLGFFRSQDSVNRRLAELNEKGYKPVVVPRFETSDLYWLSARLAEQYTDAPEIPATLLGSSAKQKTIACEAMVTDGKDSPDPNIQAKASQPMVEGLTD